LEKIEREIPESPTCLICRRDIGIPIPTMVRVKQEETHLWSFR